MLFLVKALGRLVRGLGALAALGLVGVAAWMGYESFYLPHLGIQKELREKQQEIVQLNEQLAEQNREIERLDTAMRLLTVDHRVAQMGVLEQWRRPEDQALMTAVAFGEVDDNGVLLDGYKTFTIEGDIVYIDAWVAKFLDEHVQNGVPLRSTSICLFRRLFGERQRPSEGFPLDAVGSRPAAYSRGSTMSDVERDIWSHFWSYANNPDEARQVGLRAVQGEAPSIRLAADKLYWVYLRASDGLTIKAADRRAPQLSKQPFPTRVRQTGHVGQQFH